MARVAMLRLLSEIRFSRSMLQLVTASGWSIAIYTCRGNGKREGGERVNKCTTCYQGCTHTLLRVLTAAKRVTAFGELRNICNTGKQIWQFTDQTSPPSNGTPPETAGWSSRTVTFLRLTIARAASYTTICDQRNKHYMYHLADTHEDVWLLTSLL